MPILDVMIATVLNNYILIKRKRNISALKDHHILTRSLTQLETCRKRTSTERMSP